MICRSIDFGNNKSVDIYDGLFTFAEMSDWYAFVRTSLFRVDGTDNRYLNDAGADQIYSRYSMDDVARMGLIKSPGFQSIDEKYKLLEKDKTVRVNLSTPAEFNQLHVDHIRGKTFLLYINLTWELEWGGHTLFMDENLTDAKHTCLYKPGRAVVFDGSIPHMIMTPSVACPVNRYTLAIQTK